MFSTYPCFPCAWRHRATFPHLWSRAPSTRSASTFRVSSNATWASHAELGRISTTKWGPRSIAKLVHITPITMVYGTYNYSIHGVYKPSYNWGAHLVEPSLHASFLFRDSCCCSKCSNCSNHHFPWLAHHFYCFNQNGDGEKKTMCAVKPPCFSHIPIIPSAQVGPSFSECGMMYWKNINDP